MRDCPTFRLLEAELVRGNVASQYVRRTICELQDHYEDLYAAQRARGLSHREASACAKRELGDERELAETVLQCDELKRWSARYPIASACGRSLAIAVVTPAVPVLYCAFHRASIARWGLSVGLAALLTGALLLGLDSLLPLR